MAKLPKKPSVVSIDPTLLSDEEKAQLRAQARKRVEQERKDATMDAFLQAEIEAARRASMPEEEMKYIQLDMAGHSDRIMLDGVIYFHGQTYEVPKHTYDVLAEVVGRGWEHEDQIGGANRDQYRKPRETRLGPRMTNLSASQIMGSR